MVGSTPSLGFPVQGKALEEYVHSRILDFALEHSFARRLYTSPARVHAAAKEALAELSRPNENISGRNLRLVFRHTCQSLGCLNPGCLMCKNTPHLRCATTFATKYLSGDPLKAKCGASIFVEVVDARGLPVTPDAVKGLHLEICIVEGKAYSEADPSTITDDFLDANTLLTDSKGKEVLGPGKDCESTADKRVIARFSQSQAELNVNILGSSIAMLTGQKPPFRLLVRAVDSSSGRKATGVAWAVSDAFVVATQRVKGAQKAEIPHVEEHVSKIDNVGVQTQHKLQDIRAAAATAGISGLNVVHNSVTTVGQFRDLVDSSSKDMPLQETLRKVLNFTSKGWDAAKAHAMKAVETDNRMRIWLSDDSHSKGLLFKCNLGRVDVDSPVGLLKGREDQPNNSTQVEVEAILVQHPQYDRQAANWLQKKAVKCWWKPGHPGWSIWPADSEQFIRGVVEAGDAALSPVEVQAPVPATPHATVQHSGVSQASAGPAQGGKDVSTARAGSISTILDSGSLPMRDASRTVSHETPSGTASLSQTQGSNRPPSRTGDYSMSRGGNNLLNLKAEALQSSGMLGPINSESTPSATSIFPLAMPNHSGAGHQASQPPGHWPFSMPLMNAQNMARQAQHLPASPFDLPVAPFNGSSLSTNGMNAFSFRPPTSNAGIPSGIGSMGSSIPPMSVLPTLTTHDLDQLIELQRRLHSGLSTNDSTTQSLQYLSNLSAEYQGQGDTNFPQFMSRLSGLMSDPNLASMMEAKISAPNPQYISSVFPALRTQPQGEGDQQMPLRISGKVSGIMDDLSDAMTLLHELLPSAASDIQFQAQAARTAEQDGQWPATSFPISGRNTISNTYGICGSAPLSGVPQMPSNSSAEGSNGLQKSSGAHTQSSIELFQPPAKRKRPLINAQGA